MEKYIITFNGDVDTELLKDFNAENIRTMEFITTIAFCDMTDENAKKLIESDDDRIIDVEKNADPDTDDYYLDEETGQTISYTYDQMEVGKFHEIGIKGQGVKVAVMDSGIQQHEDLRIVAGFPTNHRNLGGNHGTRVAGVIGMLENDRGGVGIAPECDLYSINRTMDGYLTQIEGMNWCIEMGIDIVNCSFSGDTDSSARREAFRIAAEEHDIIIVTSSGNKQNGVPWEIDTMTYPSRYPFVYAVGNVDEYDRLAYNSSVGSQLEFVAGGSSTGDLPGVYTTTTSSDVGAESTGISTRYGPFTGTSASAPAVTGIVALYKQMFPDLNRVDLMRKIQENSKHLGSRFLYGAGIPQFPKEKINIKMNQWNESENIFENMYPETTSMNVKDIHGDNLQNFIDSMNFPIERNELGYYVRFPNGLQIVWGEAEGQALTEWANGEKLARSDNSSFTFPMAFKSSPIFCTANVLHPWRWAEVSGTASSTGVNYRQYGANQNEEVPTVTVFAIGLWR